MLENGYIRLHRALTGWRWYKEPKVLHLWLHILLMANYEPRDFEDRTIERGQLATSVKSLSDQTGLTVQEVRTALAKLKKTGEIDTWSNRHMTIITVSNYDAYQSDATDRQQTDNIPSTNQQQTDNNPSTDNQQQWKKDKKAKKEKKITPIPPYGDFGFSETMQERLDEWLRYKAERNEDYQPTGLHNLLKTVARAVERLGEPAVLDRITDAMAAGWRGMNLDKMEAKRGTAANTKFSGLGERI